MTTDRFLDQLDRFTKAMSSYETTIRTLAEERDALKVDLDRALQSHCSLTSELRESHEELARLREQLAIHTKEKRKGVMVYYRWRFKVPFEDYRPIKFPPPGPYWCTGYDMDDNAILVSYLPVSIEVTSNELWPDAFDVTRLSEGPEFIRFTSRFSRPEWWSDSAK